MRHAVPTGVSALAGLLVVLGLVVAVPSSANATDQDRWRGFAITAFGGTAAGKWIGGYQVDGRVAHRIDPGRKAPMGRVGDLRWTTKVGANARRAHRAAWVLSKYGAARDPDSRARTNIQAAAVDAAVLHLLRGKAWRITGAKGERRIDQAGYSPLVRRWAMTFVRQSHRLAGPYRVDVTTNSPTVGGETTATATVRSARGRAVENLPVTLDYGDRDAFRATTDQRGRVVTTWPSGTAGEQALRVTVHRLPTTSLGVRVPARGSRIALAGRRTSRTSQTRVIVRATPTVTAIPAGQKRTAQTSFKTWLKVARSGHGTKALVRATLHGPFSSAAAASCSGEKIATTRRAAIAGNQRVRVKSLKLRPGVYRWQVSRPGDDWNAAATACTPPLRIVKR
ncbi:hypothetical protein FXB39_01940 [Nocardioides sp. BGMRC 2183]|nr:hypothetical protein FXB39_01940 [Nocardioides sp. BGMRC 2183]